MARNEMETSGCLPPADIERMIDRAIDGLAKMDADLLVQLASHCCEWEEESPRLSLSPGAHVRLSWKLLLLNRLLRQTRVNLNVLGFEPQRYSPAEGYQAFARH